MHLNTLISMLKGREKKKGRKVTKCYRDPLFVLLFNTGQKEATLKSAQYQPGVHRLQNEFLFCIGGLDSDCDFLQREEQEGSGIAL